ncbi:hypothetical protein QUW13_05690 [Enterococcus hirae]|nr:hypothetical protein [Enterococcus hirae]
MLSNVPQMIQIGSTGRNSGKTTVARQLIKRFKAEYPIYAVKIITITGARGKCQRGGEGCGICTSISDGFDLTEETKRGTKDTMELLKAGAEKVYLLKAFEDHLLDGFLAFMKQVPKNALIICESNSLRELIVPGVFVMMNNQKKRIKPTAAKVFDLADVYLEDAADPLLDQVSICRDQQQRLMWFAPHTACQCAIS